VVCDTILCFPQQYHDVSQHYVDYITDVKNKVPLPSQKLKRFFELCHYLDGELLFGCLDATVVAIMVIIQPYH